MKAIIEKQKELHNAKNELIAWLNDECPLCLPPLEPYTTFDLSHDFADLLRSRLNNITILRGQLSELAPLETDEKDELKKILYDFCIYISYEHSLLPKFIDEYIKTRI